MHRSNYKYNKGQEPQHCRFCGNLNIATKYCNCRRDLLRGIPFKDQCQPLRLQGSPAQLLVDVKILNDIFPAVIDTKRLQTTVNPTIVKYLGLINHYPKIDNTIDVTMKVQNRHYKFNCMIENSPHLISLGLTALLDIGFKCSLGNQVIEKRVPYKNTSNDWQRRQQNTTTPVHSAKTKPINPYADLRSRIASTSKNSENDQSTAAIRNTLQERPTGDVLDIYASDNLSD